MGWIILALLASDFSEPQKVTPKTPLQIHLDSVQPVCTMRKAPEWCEHCEICE